MGGLCGECDSFHIQAVSCRAGVEEWSVDNPSDQSALGVCLEHMLDPSASCRRLGARSEWGNSDWGECAGWLSG